MDNKKVYKFTLSMFNKAKSKSIIKKNKKFIKYSNLKVLKYPKFNNLKEFLLNKYDNKLRLNEVEKKQIYNFLKGNKTEETERKLLILIITNSHIDIKYKKYYYKNLNESYNQNLNDIKLIINNDIKRTNNYDNNKKDIMNQILFNFCKRNQIISYCQGMNTIVEYFLSKGYNEEDTFWIICYLFENILPINYYINMSPIIFFLKIIEEYLKINNSKLYLHLQNLDLKIEICLLECFIILFLNIKNEDIKNIVIEYLFLNGYNILIKIIIMVFKNNEDKLLKYDSIVEFKNEISNIILNLNSNNFKKDLKSVYINKYILKDVVNNLINNYKFKKIFSTCNKTDDSFCFNNLNYNNCFIFQKKNLNLDIKINYLFSNNNKILKDEKQDEGSNEGNELLIIRKMHNCISKHKKNIKDSLNLKIQYFNEAESKIQSKFNYLNSTNNKFSVNKTKSKRKLSLY